MATSITLGAVLVADGFDMSSHFKSVDLSQNTDMLDATVLSATSSRTYAPGLTERTLSGEGFFAYDGTTDALSLDKQFADAMGSSSHKIITFGKNGATLGYPATMLGTKQASYNIQETVGELMMLTFEAKATNGSTPAYGFAAGGVWLGYQAVTGTVNVASHDNAASSTGYLAHAHCTVDDVTTMTIKIQHSTDNSSWADLITFTNFTAVGAQQSANTATSVNRYLRVICSAFTGTSANIAVAIKTGYSG